MRRGDVWRVRLPPAAGHVQSGIRPAVILLHDTLHQIVPITLVVPFTSQTTTMQYLGTYLVQATGTNGLQVPSVAMAFQVRALDQRDCLTCHGTLDLSDLNQIIAELDKLIR